MTKTVFLEVFENISIYINKLIEFENVYLDFFNLLVIFGAIALFLGVRAYRKLGLLISFSLVALFISYIMRDIENIGYIVTSFSILGLLAAFAVHSSDFGGYFVYVVFLVYSLMRYLGIDHWILVIIAALLVAVAYRAIPSAVIILVSVTYGSIIASLHFARLLDIDSIYPYIILMFFGFLIQVGIGIKRIEYEWEMFLERNKRGQDEQKA